MQGEIESDSYEKMPSLPVAACGKLGFRLVAQDFCRHLAYFFSVICNFFSIKNPDQTDGGISQHAMAMACCEIHAWLAIQIVAKLSNILNSRPSPMDAICGCRNSYLKSVDFAETKFQNIVKSKHEVKLLRAGTERSGYFLFGACNGDKENSACEIGRIYPRSSVVERFDDADTIGAIVGIGEVGEKLLSCHRNPKGDVVLWTKNSDKSIDTEVILSAGSDLYCMDQKNKFIATGGKENDVSVYDITNGERTFQAKNVKPDWLQLRVPIWVRQIRFLSDNEIITATNHHQIRLYDLRANSGQQRRPVIDFEWLENPITALELNKTNERQIFTGNTIGQAAMLDIRKKRTVYAYKGNAGAVKAISQCDDGKSIVVGCLDRYVRKYDVSTRVKEAEVYTKSEVNCVAVNVVGRDDGSDDELDEMFERIESGKRIVKDEGGGGKRVAAD